MDKFVETISALGVPGIVLVVAMATTGWAGAAAITAALALLGGPLGMLGGLGMLFVLSRIAQALTEYRCETILRAVVSRLRMKGVSYEDVKRTVEAYPISRSLKHKIYYFLDSFENPEPTTS